MNTQPAIDVPHGDEVTTEPQRLALEAMSQDLVCKLNAMVAEQERRAQEFAAQQHSLSSLPSFSVPEIQPPSLPQPTVTATAPLPKAARRVKARMEQPAPTPQPTYRNEPELPPVPQQRTQRQTRSAWDEQWQPHMDASKQPKLPKMPTIIRDTPAEKKESSVGAGTIATIIFVLFILIMRSCE